MLLLFFLKKVNIVLRLFKYCAMSYTDAMMLDRDIDFMLCSSMYLYGVNL